MLYSHSQSLFLCVCVGMRFHVNHTLLICLFHIQFYTHTLYSLASQGIYIGQDKLLF